METTKSISVPSKSYVSKTRIGVLAVSSMGMAALAITPSYAAIASNFSLSNTSVQMLTSLPNLFMMLAGLIIGKLTATKLNLKTLTLSAAILVIVGGFLPLAFHTNFMFLLFCSCLVGLGQGACTNLSQVLISQMLPETERQSTMGLTTTFTNLGGIVFIMGGGQLAATSGWVNNYWIYLFSVLVLVVILTLVPMHPATVNAADDQGTGEQIKLNKYVFYCAFWGFCTLLLNNVLNNNISLFVVEEKLGATSQAALTSTVSLIGGMLCGLIVGVIGKRFKYSSITISFILYGLSYLLIGFGHSLWLAFVGSFVVGAAMSIAMGQFPYLISISVGKNSVSMALGVYVAIYSIGGVVSPFVVNPLTKLVAGMGINVFVVSGVIALLLGVLCMGLQFQKKLVTAAAQL
ncbi:MFS transporter [Lactiplantibacillus paraplantarum]|uniref:MFS transporter n=1 Tax=Lactiplantibacillus paraplantarum TaxID=60520 RepID=A0AAD0TPY6_9LACO|nr:MFS transporter [Lactiplantibacillus paraplantarum]AVW09215.1 MFS transporter [Lactiplantibacillus paraplantarum]AYJ37481.1 MFS transporter [Lactiplantibacillus paraplantarum]ERL45255.1 major facilitator family transporter [Lactiplantibacillus paraplantarum]KRL51198.1 major facilitator family transporter [Lactiplantibacillus paraplantarum DSM 10667]MCU4682437.1 MFS transporter [Lactiplantibacillus paraplantarum]